MRGKLWCLRLILVLVVTALVFSPLAVRGASIASQPVGWNHDPSSLMLPSSPTYPAVVAYRDIRMQMADRSFEKSELLLGFANQDAAAINTMARRQDFVSAAGHATTYQQTLDRCVGWLVIASERGNDVSYLLSRIMNDHMAQQAALGQALGAMPEWSSQSVDAARRHAAEIILQAVELLGDSGATRSYHAAMASAFPELELSQPKSANSPSIVVVAPPSSSSAVASEQPIEDTSSAALTIVSLSAERYAVGFGETVDIQSVLAPDSEGVSFSWWCSRGGLVATATSATWTAPDRAGVYEINLTVSDAHGSRDSRSIEIEVLEDETPPGATDTEDDEEEPVGNPGTSPKIAALTLSADHKYFEESYGGGYSILVSRTCTIRCEVDDPDTLDFEWSVTGGGRIDGSGDVVTLSVPASPGYVKVTVTTPNQLGETDTASVTLYVSTCTYCF